MLSERRRHILSLVAQGYIATARPVPSARVAEKLRVSSATVRNEFAVLEEQGMLLQQHASSGRLPSLQGLDYYAKSFIPPGTLPPSLRRFIAASIDRIHGDQLLQRVAQLAADLSGYAVVVRLAPDESLHALQIHLNALSSERLLAVVILENGLVRQQVLTLDPLPDHAVLSEAEASLSRLSLPVSRLKDATLQLAASAQGDLRRLFRVLAAAFAQLNPGQVFTHGLSNLLEEPEAQDPAFLKLAVREFESPGPTVKGGAALDLILAESTARVRAALPLGKIRAELNLVGPARMRYPETFRILGGIATAVGSAASRPIS